MFGPVASDPTGSRLIDTGGKRALTAFAGPAPRSASGQVIVDLDGCW